MVVLCDEALDARCQAMGATIDFSAPRASMIDGCRGCVACGAQLEGMERLADDESRSWPALDNASGTRLHFTH